MDLIFQLLPAFVVCFWHIDPLNLFQSHHSYLVLITFTLEIVHTLQSLKVLNVLLEKLGVLTTCQRKACGFILLKECFFEEQTLLENVLIHN